jgi:uncharacterized membrane protein YkgB
MNLKTRELDLQSGLSSALAKVRGCLSGVGTGILRYSLVFFLLMFGALKWTKGEANGIQPLIVNSPLMSWMYHFLSVQGASIAVGVVELLLGLMIACRRFLPRISAWGSVLSIFMFLTTLSFLFTTPHIDEGTQGFLMKDLVLLGAAVATAGEAFEAALEKQIRAWMYVAKEQI